MLATRDLWLAACGSWLATGLATRDSRLAIRAATIGEETMIAFQITINGQKYCESEDISVFTMVAEEIQRREAFRISLHAGGPDSPLQWLTANLRVGDEIAIRVVDTSEFEPSAPPTCSFCAREVHEVSTLSSRDGGGDLRPLRHKFEQRGRRMEQSCLWGHRSVTNPGGLAASVKTSPATSLVSLCETALQCVRSACAVVSR